MPTTPLVSTSPEKPVSLRRLLLAAGLGYLLLYAAWLLWGRADMQERQWLGGLGLLYPAGLAVLAAILARSHHLAQQRRAWQLALLGVSLWALSALARVLLSSFNPTLLYQFGLVDGLHGLGALLLAAAGLLFPRQPRLNSSFSHRLVDGVLTTAALVPLLWLLVLRPAQLAPPTAVLRGETHPFPLFFPLMDILLLLVLVNLFLLTEVNSQPAAVIWFTLGTAAYTFSDLTYVSLLTQRSYLVGSPVDIGWTLAFTCFLLAAAGTVGFNGPFWQRTGQRLQTLLPLISVLLLGWYALLEWQLTGASNSLAMWMTVILGVGLIARQGLLLGEVEFQQYASLVNSVAEPIFICDAHGRLRLTNPALLDATGYTSERMLLRQPLQLLLHPAETMSTVLDAARRGGWSGELSLRRSSGELTPIALTLRPIDAGAGAQIRAGDRLLLAGTAHNLSEQKRQQAALQNVYEQIAAAHAELEQMNIQLEYKVAEKTANLSDAYRQLEEQHRTLQVLDRLKSDFVSLVSHELRAPLTNINGGIELTLALQQDLPANTRQNLELVQAEINRLTRFVETILDLSALDAGRVPLYPGPLALAQVVRVLQAQMTHLPGGERIIWQAPDDLPLLLADERALASILFHLLDNALKYAPQGPITVQAAAVDGRACLQVMDEGPGISADALPFVFERFYRHPAEDAQTVYGHGLGLYIVQRLLAAMQGSVTVENRPQGGACFTCWLPLSPESAL